MAQKKKWVSSHGHGSSLANTKAPKKKKSIVNTKKANLYNQISISSRENGTNQIINGEEEDTRKFELSRCQIKKKSIDKVIGINLPEEILMGILSRLAVRSLLRFKCVSKFWNSLIVDPYFKRTHYIQSQNSQKLLITKKWLGKDHVYSFYSSS